MILYEYPFNESIRTQLPLERLFSRFSALCQREEPTDHHFALASLFEIMDVASQMDVRADIIKNLERHQSLFLSYQGNPQVSENTLTQVLDQITDVVDVLGFQTVRRTNRKFEVIDRTQQNRIDSGRLGSFDGGRRPFQISEYS